MSEETVVCLGCGGLVGVPGGCGCPPPSLTPRSRPYRDASVAQRCPRCAGRLVERSYADLEVLDCAGCAGLFVDLEAMHRLKSPEGRELRLALPKRVRVAESEVRYLPCPSCGTTMNRTVFGRMSGVIVDVCPDHGVWFDAGEINAVIDFIESGGVERAERKAREDRAEENRRLTEQLKETITDTARLSHVRPGPAAAHRSPFYESMSSLFGWRF